MAGPKGDSELWLPETLLQLRIEEKQNSLFPVESVIKCFFLTSQLKNRTTCEKLFTWRWPLNKFPAVSRCTTWSRASRELKSLFSWGVIGSELWPMTRDMCSPRRKTYLNWEVYQNCCSAWILTKFFSFLQQNNREAKLLVVGFRTESNSSFTRSCHFKDSSACQIAKDAYNLLLPFNTSKDTKTDAW